MSDRIELPAGHWAEIRDPMEVTERQKRPLKALRISLGKAFAAKPSTEPVPTPDPSNPATAPKSAADLMSVDELLDATEAFEYNSAAFFIESWDFDFPPTADSVQDIPGPVYAELDKAIGQRLIVLFPDMEQKKPDSPTTP